MFSNCNNIDEVEEEYGYEKERLINNWNISMS